MPESHPSDDLMALIHSLNKSEKRHFRLYIGEGIQGGKGIYVELYDHLLQAGTWSEPAIKKAFAGRKFIRQLNVARGRLQGLILEALRSYDAGASYQLEFSRRLDEIDILYRRRLFPACQRAISSAMRKAQALELPVQELSLLQWEMRLERQKSGDNLNARLAPFHTQNQVVAYKIMVEADLLEVVDAMIALLPQHAENPRDAKAQADHLLQSQVLRPPLAAMGFEARILYRYIYSLHALVHGNTRAYCDCQRLLVEVWDSCPIRKDQEEDRYIRILIGYADSTLAVAAFEESSRIIARIKRRLDKSARLQAREKARLLNLQLSLHIDTHAWENAAGMEQEIEATLQDASIAIPPLARVALASNLLVAMLISTRWAPALHWARRLEQEAGPQSAEQWRALIRFARWIAWYESGEHDPLEAALRQTQREAGPAWEGSLALHFVALLDAASPSAELATWTALAAQATAMQAHHASLHLDLLQTWCIARTQGISLPAAEAKRKALG
jgi:hypothetical protein